MSGRSVLVCVAHPDDEVLGCGGAMAVHADGGDTLHVCFVADGVTSRVKPDDAHAAEAVRRRGAAAKAVAILGAGEPHYLDFPDQRLDTFPLLEITQKIEALADTLRPEIVYTHHGDDLNADHRIVNQAVMTAFRPFPGQCVRAIYSFETLSSTEWAFGSRPAFAPTRFVGIERSLDRKLAALEAYSEEMRAFPHARSLEAVRALAAYRGATVGLPAAEAFTVLRQVEA